MNIKFFYFSIIMLAFFAAKADSPGKREMHACDVSFQNIKKWNDYTFHYNSQYDNSDGLINTDTTFTIPGSGGVPFGFSIWAINNKTHKSTDTVYFFNHYDPDKVIILAGFDGDSIRYNTGELSNANEIIATVNADSIANKELVEKAEKIKQNHYNKIAVYAIAALIALTGLVWFFNKKRKKQVS